MRALLGPAYGLDGLGMVLAIVSRYCLGRNDGHGWVLAIAADAVFVLLGIVLWLPFTLLGSFGYLAVDMKGWRRNRRRARGREVVVQDMVESLRTNSRFRRALQRYDA